MLMKEDKFKTGFKYQKSLEPYKYFVKWKDIVEKHEIDLENNLRLDFPEMGLLWKTCNDRYLSNMQTLKNDSRSLEYRKNVHYTLLIWLVPLLLINKFRRLKWEISEPDWSRIILGNPNENKTEGHGYFLK